MKKYIILLLLSFSLTSFAQVKQYWNYNPVDSTFISTHLYKIKNPNSTDIKPTIDTQFAKWNGTVWVDSRTPEQILKALVPKVVSRRQLKLQLTLNGFNMSLIDYAIGQLGEPERSFALIGWNDAIEFERSNQMLIGLATQLGITDAQLDQLFIDASKL